jgi:hypothetical protein
VLGIYRIIPFPYHVTANLRWETEKRELRFGVTSFAADFLAIVVALLSIVQGSLSSLSDLALMLEYGATDGGRVRVRGGSLGRIIALSFVGRCVLLLGEVCGLWDDVESASVHLE